MHIPQPPVAVVCIGHSVAEPSSTAWADIAGRQLQVVLAANALPAINDITADELRTLVGQAAAVDPVIQVTTGVSLHGAIPAAVRRKLASPPNSANRLV